MKQIHVREANLPDLDGTISRLWRDSTLSLVGPEEEAQEDQGNTNSSALRKAAQKLGLPETATLEEVRGALGSQDYRELIVTYTSGATNTFYLTALQLDRYPELDGPYQ